MLREFLRLLRRDLRPFVDILMLSYYCIPLARRYVLFAIFTKSNYARLYCWRANNPDIYLPAALEECRRSCHETSNYMARNQLSFVPPQPSRKYHERPLQLNPSYIAVLHCELGGSRPWPYFDEVRVFCVDTARLDFFEYLPSLSARWIHANVTHQKNALKQGIFNFPLTEFYSSNEQLDKLFFICASKFGEKFSSVALKSRWRLSVGL